VKRGPLLSNSNNNIVFERYDFGHRSDYAMALARAIQATPVVGSPFRFIPALVRADRLLFSTFDDALFLYSFVGIIRSLIGKNTACLILRPTTALHRHKFKHFVKYLLLLSLKHMTKCRVMTILPFWLEPKFATIASDWIDDPQLWDADLLTHKKTCDNELSKLMKSRAGGRKIIIALGGQNRSKGFELLVALWCQYQEVRSKYQFVVCGPVSKDSRATASAFTIKGGILFDKTLEASQFIAMYHCADAVWNCYAPEYNQASGLFGRAVQHGVPSIVRQGSFLEKLAINLGHPSLTIPFQGTLMAARRLCEWSPSVYQLDERVVEKLQRNNVRKLLAALGETSVGIKVEV
jgi:hypothetical protein